MPKPRSATLNVKLGSDDSSDRRNRESTVMALNANSENTTLSVNQGSDDGSDRRNREYDSDGSECQTKTDDYERQFKEDDSERNK